MSYVRPDHLSVNFTFSGGYAPPIPADFIYTDAGFPKYATPDGFESLEALELARVIEDITTQTEEYSATEFDLPTIGTDQHVLVSDTYEPTLTAYGELKATRSPRYLNEKGYSGFAYGSPFVSHQDPAVNFVFSGSYAPPIPADFIYTDVAFPKYARVKGFDSLETIEPLKIDIDKTVRILVREHSATEFALAAVATDQYVPVPDTDTSEAIYSIDEVWTSDQFVYDCTALTLTEYGDPELVRSPRYLNEKGYLGFEYDLSFISYWHRPLYFTAGTDTLSLGPVVIGTDQYIEPVWAATLLSELPKVIRFLEIQVDSDAVQTKTGDPSVEKDRAIYPSALEFTELSTDHWFSYWTRFLDAPGDYLLSSEEPATIHNNWHFVLFEEATTVLPETQYGTYYSVLNKNRLLSPEPIDSQLSDGWEHTVRNKDLVAGHALTDTSEIEYPWLSNYIREITPEVGALYDYFGKPTISNTGRNFTPNAEYATDYGIPYVIFSERTISAYMVDVTEYENPVMGWERTVEHREAYPFRFTDYGSFTVLPRIQEIKDIEAEAPPYVEKSLVREVFNIIDIPQTKNPYSEYYSLEVTNRNKEPVVMPLVSPEFGFPTIYNLVQEVQVPSAFPNETTKQIETIVEKDEFIYPPGNGILTTYYWWTIVNELVPPVDLTQTVYHPRDERGDHETVTYDPETKYGEIKLPSVGAEFENGDLFTTYGDDFRIDNMVVGCYDGLIYFKSDPPEVSHLHRIIEIDEKGDDYSNPNADKHHVGPQHIDFECSRFPLTNNIDDGCGRDSLPVNWPIGIIELQHRTILVSSSAHTQYGQIPPDVLQLGSPQYCDVTGGSTPKPGAIIVYPYEQEMAVASKLSFEFDNATIANERLLPISFDITTSVPDGAILTIYGLVDGQNQHREILIDENDATIFGDNYPMIHFERGFDVNDYEATLCSDDNWISPNPQIKEIDGDELLDNDWDLFYGKMHVMQKPQHITPLGIDATKLGLIRMRRRL